MVGKIKCNNSSLILKILFLYVYFLHYKYKMFKTNILIFLIKFVGNFTLLRTNC